MRERGKVTMFHRERGFGFIAPDYGVGNVFVHVRSVRPGEPELHPGDIVEYLANKGPRGLFATEVAVIR